MKFLFVFFFFAAALAFVSADQYYTPSNEYYHHQQPQHLPVIGANGVPVDTPAVQHATAAHLAHKVEAHARNGDYEHPQYPQHYYPGLSSHSQHLNHFQQELGSAVYDHHHHNYQGGQYLVKPQAYPSYHHPAGPAGPHYVA